MHLLDRYPADMGDTNRFMNAPEFRLVSAYRAADDELNSLVGIPAKFITITIVNDELIPTFDIGAREELLKLVERERELKARRDELLTRIDKLYGLFPDTDLKTMYETKRNLEASIKQYQLFPTELKAVQDKYTAICKDIEEYLDILKDI